MDSNRISLLELFIFIVYKTAFIKRTPDPYIFTLNEAGKFVRATEPDFPPMKVFHSTSCLLDACFNVIRYYSLFFYLY